MFETLKEKAKALLKQPPSMVMLDYVTRGMAPPPEVLEAMQDWYRRGPQIGALLFVPGSRLAAIKLIALAMKEDPDNAQAILLASITPHSWWFADEEMVGEEHKTTLPFPRMQPVPPVETFRIVFETRALVPRPSGDAPATRTVTKVFVGDRQVRDVESVLVNVQKDAGPPNVIVNMGQHFNDPTLSPIRRQELRDTYELLQKVPFVRIAMQPRDESV